MGGKLTADPRISGVAFTGSNETAALINRSLAARRGADHSFYRRDGRHECHDRRFVGLPEQAVRDVISSAFDSAGQRCSAARILFVQDDIAGRLLPMLKGAIGELRVGDPLDYATDVGPVIDRGGPGQRSQPQGEDEQGGRSDP